MNPEAHVSSPGIFIAVGYRGISTIVLLMTPPTLRLILIISVFNSNNMKKRRGWHPLSFRLQHFGNDLGWDRLCGFTGTVFGSGFLVERIGLHFVFVTIQEISNHESLAPTL
jgi:hypothetical protein